MLLDKAARLIIVFVCPALLATSVPSPLLAAAGDLDLTFGGFGDGGKVVTTSQQIDPIWARGPTADMALYPDDRVVVAGHRGRLVPGTTFYDVVVLRYLSNGSPDPTFGNGGKVIWEAPSATGALVNSVAVQPDGKVVLAGSYQGSFLVVRLNVDGSLDSTFGSGGIRSTHIGAFSHDNAVSAVLIQPDGRIVVAGTWSYSATGSSGFAVARFNADGSSDTSFGQSSGTVVVYDTAYNLHSPDVALQNDGKLVLAGTAYLESTGNDFAVVRLNGDGTLDTGFSGDGTQITDFGTAQDIAYAVAIQADDRIVVAGHDETVNDNVLVARYLSNGALDNTFDGDGKLTLFGQSGGSYDVAVQPDGKIVLLGSFELPGAVERFAFYRLNANGTLDVTFDGDGSTYLDMGGGTDKGYALGLLADGRIQAFGTHGSYPALARLWHDGTLDAGGKQAMGFADPLWGPGSNEQALAMAVQPADGKIVVAGIISDASSSDYDFALARFLPDGRPDSSFGTDGRVTYGFGGDQFARAVAVQPADGKIVVGGYTINGSAINFMLARFNPDGTPDGTCGFGGFNVMDFLGGDDYCFALTLAPDGKIVMAGNAFNGARHVFGVARFNTDCTPDLSLDGDGNTLYEFSVGPSHRGSAVVVQPDRKIVLGGTVGADFGLVRLHENGQVDYSFGTYPYGHVVTDMGGDDYLNALILTPGEWFVAAGNRIINGTSDYALAQYDPNGVLPPAGPGQPWAKAFVDFGGVDVAYALDRRGDAVVAAAGISDGKLSWAQLPTSVQLYTVIKGIIDFPGSYEGAYGVKFTGGNKVLTAGFMLAGDGNIALARSLTTPDTSCAVDDDCDDFNPCTTDTCEQSSGCAFTNSTGPCDDGNACTVGDVCDAGSCQPGAPVPPPGEAQNLQAIGKTTYIWSATSGATRYDVVRGSLTALPVGPGGDDEVCFDDLGGTALIDATTPAPGAGFWYLSRGENTCANGTFGSEGFLGAPAAPRITTTCP